jgi:putative membrane protein
VKIPAMIAAEFRRLTATRMSVIALIALLAVPILYGGLYLWANQDPYGRLSQVPVALVVDDAGAEINGTARNLGDEVAQQLIGSGTFDWRQVDAAAAAAGLDDGTFDFSVEVPADFTAAISSISSSSPHAATLQLRTNDANNYLATTIGKQAVERIQTTVTEKVVSEAGLTMLDGLNTIRMQLSDASAGAQQLVDGLGTARSGAAQLIDGSQQLASGTAQLRDGAASLSGGSAQVADGAAQVADGTGRLDAIAQRVSAAADDVAAAVPEVRADIAQSLAEAGLDPAAIDRVLAALDPLGERVSVVDARVQGAVAQVDRLNDGAQQVSAGARQVADGSAQLSAGAASAADGAAQLQAGIGTLDGGLGQLADGAQQLQTGLAKGVAQLPDTDEATRQQQAATLAAPVSVDAATLAPAQNYGAGLAPFFAALAGWIGIYALFLIVKPISRRAVTALHSPVRVTLAGWATPALFGGLQMLGLFGVLALALGFSFANPLATLGILFLASFTYAAIILALNVWLGSVGQFLGLVLMVLQLVTAGGTFPWQTLPAPLAGLNHVLPMGYVVDAMRQVMYGGDLGRVGGDLLVLAAWLVGALVFAAIGVTRMTHRRTLRDLQPSLIG